MEIMLNNISLLDDGKSQDFLWTLHQLQLPSANVTTCKTGCKKDVFFDTPAGTLRSKLTQDSIDITEQEILDSNITKLNRPRKNINRAYPYICQFCNNFLTFTFQLENSKSVCTSNPSNSLMFSHNDKSFRWSHCDDIFVRGHQFKKTYFCSVIKLCLSLIILNVPTIYLKPMFNLLI